MSYATELQNEVSQGQFLAVIKPRRRVNDFTVFSGAVYSAQFAHGNVTRVWADGLELTENTSTALNVDEFYYDYTNEVLYVRLTGGGDPDSVWLIAEYEIYLGTYDAHWYRLPTDNTTRTVYFEPLISSPPNLKQSISDNIFGFNPIQSAQIRINNAEHDFELHIHDSSFNQAEVKIYHWIGDLEIANIKLVLNGVCKNPTLNQPFLTIQIFDGVDLLNNEWRNPGGASSFFNTIDFPNCDPQALARPIRMIYGGPVDGFVPVNIDFVALTATTTPTTSDNRDWVVCTGQTNLADLSFTVAASPSSTTTRTYLTAAPNGVNIGDSIWLDKATDEYAIVTAIGANYLDHTTIVTPAVNPETVKRAFVGSVTIIKDDVEYTARYNRDYTIQNYAGISSGFQFTTSLESNLGMPSTLLPTDKVYCRAYGPSNFVTLGGPSFGTSDIRTSGFNHPAQIVLDILKRMVGVVEADINSSSFTSALSDAPYGMSLVIPETSTGGFENYRTIITKIIKSSLIRLVLDADGKWSITVYKPLTASSKTIADDEILLQTIQFLYNYDELVSEIIVEYNRQETSNNITSDEIVDTVSSSSATGAYLHKVSKSRTERLLWTYAVDAQTFADRLVYIFGDRLGKVTLSTKNRFFDNIVGDILTIDRASLPGNIFDQDLTYSRDYRISSIDKSLNTVTIELDDQKGAEDNLGSW